MAISRKAQKPRNLAQDYQDTFLRSEAGKSVLEDLEKKGFFTRSSFDPNPYQTAHNEGMRSLVLRIHHYLNSNPTEANGPDTESGTESDE